VQVHDPFLKRVLVEAIKEMFRQVKHLGLKIGFKDLGAGGIACVTSEIAAAGGFGVNLQLDQVNAASSIFPPEVIACSETQERFCIAVPSTHSQLICDIFNKQYELPKIYHNAGAVIIGRACVEPFYTIYWKGEQLARLPIHAITTEVRAVRTATPREINRTNATAPTSNLEAKHFLDILANPNVCSKRYVYRSYDNAVRGDTVVYPGEADSVIITPIKGCNTGFTVNMSSNLYGEYDPYMSGAYAVAEAVRNVVSVGGMPIAFTDCLNYGNPEKPDVFFDFQEGVKGLADAAYAFSFKANEPLPVISGNVSFYNESKQGSAIIPSPVIMVAGRVEDYRKSVTMQVKAAGSSLILVGQRYAEFGGTQIAELISGLNTVAPQVRFQEEALANNLVHNLINQQQVLACHDISAGGLWVTLSEMLLGERSNFKFGASITVPNTMHPLSFLFSENGGYVLEVAKNKSAAVKNSLNTANVAYYELGETTTEAKINVNLPEQPALTFALADLSKSWNIKNIW
jgi:phosphoribosylformylglycinamidine synthase